MQMSMVEISSRANFLIYDYIKSTLKHNDFAEQFRNVIQDHTHKDIILFKGLDKLTMVLLKYYSSQVAVGIVEPNGPVAAADATKTPAASSPGDALEVEADAVGESKSERKRKQKRKQKHPEEEAQEAAAEQAEPARAAPEELQQDADAESGKAERKKKKKKRHPEVENGGEKPAATNGEVEVEAKADVTAEATPAAEESEAPKKKRRKHKTAAAEAKAEAATESVDVGGACEPNSNPVDKEAEQRPTEQDAASSDAAPNGSGASGGKKQKRHSQPYRRVREEEVVNKHFRDNSFEAKLGAATGWGYKANEDLRPTQGRSFRHEKTKKKRGSYKGGAIDTGVSSFKFESESE